MGEEEEEKGKGERAQQRDEKRRVWVERISRLHTDHFDALANSSVQAVDKRRIPCLVIWIWIGAFCGLELAGVGAYRRE